MHVHAGDSIHSPANGFTVFHFTTGGKCDSEVKEEEDSKLVTLNNKPQQFAVILEQLRAVVMYNRPSSVVWLLAE